MVTVWKCVVAGWPHAKHTHLKYIRLENNSKLKYYLTYLTEITIRYGRLVCDLYFFVSSFRTRAKNTGHRGRHITIQQDRHASLKQKNRRMAWQSCGGSQGERCSQIPQTQIQEDMSWSQSDQRDFFFSLLISTFFFMFGLPPCVVVLSLSHCQGGEWMVLALTGLWPPGVMLSSCRCGCVSEQKLNLGLRLCKDCAKIIQREN